MRSKHGVVPQKDEMPMNRLDYSNETTNPPEYMEIDTGRKRRWMGLAAYVIFYLAVSSLLVFLLSRFTASLALAVGLVAFMVGYMTLMGWWASRGWSGDRDPREGGM
jgi:hypothetical protein